MNMIAWKAWYRGGAAYCSNASLLPDDEMLGVMVVFDDGTRRNLTGSDWYWLVEILGKPTWCQGAREEYRTREDIIERYPGAMVIRGVWTSDEEMRRALNEMAEYEG